MSWILEGEAPAFLKFEGPLYEGGPIWRIESRIRRGLMPTPGAGKPKP